jgi:hypothetical protein
VKSVSDVEAGSLFAVKAFADEEGAYIDAVPSLAEELAGQGIYSVADGPVYDLTVDFGDMASKERALALAMHATDEVEACCPWAKRFGVDGTGEGIVWVPTGEHWGHTLDMRSMGHFLKWVGQDVKRECALELEANALEWKHVTKDVTDAAKRFFSEYVKRLELV